MPYIDDMISSTEKHGELFSEPIGKLNHLSTEVASKMFSDVKLHDSENIFYFPFKLCHSFPQVNKRGRTFSPNVLANSFASLTDQLIDYEHCLESNGLGADRIIGHVKAAQFTLPKKYKSDEIASIASPLAVTGLAAMFLRATGVKEALEDHINGNASWDMSMECGHSWKDAVFSYQDEFIPVKDAEIAMRNCITPDAVKPYKGKKLSVFLGGMDGEVDFWGVGFTRTPADNLATSDILYFIGGQNKEVSSSKSKKSFFMPLRRFSNIDLEVASSSVDKKITELASISIIGETDPDASDGHTHYILSDLSILPADSSVFGSHMHYSRGFHVSRGSNPSVTGVTDSCNSPSVYNENGECINRGTNKVHVHTVNIKLKGKYKSDTTLDDVEDEEELTISEVSSMKKKLNELLNELNSTVSSLTAAKTDEARNAITLEIASKQKEIAEINSKESSEAEKKSFLDEQLNSGKIISKEKADDMVAQAVKEAEEKHKKELEAEKIRQARLEKCREYNIDLDTKYDGIMADDGTEMTFKKKLDLLGVDELGTKQFNMDLMAWKELFKETPVAANPEIPATPVQQAATQQNAVHSEAANTGIKKPKKVLALASAGGSASETASTQETEEKPKTPKHLMGKRALSLS
jgi:hypothetical protein